MYEGEGRYGRREATPGHRAMRGGSVAAMTALISGVSVFVNGYGVRTFSSPALYTTAKNLMAAVVLAGLSLAAVRRQRTGPQALDRWLGSRSDKARRAGNEAIPPESAARGIRRLGLWLGLSYVGIVGGGVAFVVFFDGLAVTEATPATFLHDGLVLFVALLAVPLLRERLGGWQVFAIALLLIGQVAVLGGVGRLVADRGEMLVLLATVLWAIEVVISRQLLVELPPAFVSLVRMGGGSLALVVYLGASGSLSALGSLSASQVGWVVLTGLLLAGYVATWLTALSRAPAVEVTSVLVGSTVVTSLLSALTGGLPVAPALVGLLLISIGVAMFIRRGVRQVAA